MKKFISGSLSCILFCFGYLAKAQTTGFVQDDIIKVSGIQSDNQIYGLSAAQKETTRNYYDGFGRPVQVVAVQASPLQTDVIQPIVYDNLGQQSQILLPYAGNDGSGAYRPNAVSTEQPAFYNNGVENKVTDDSSPFSQQVFENSPLHRLLKSGMVGSGFQPAGSGTQHYKIVSYRQNISSIDGGIILWGSDGANQGSYTDNMLSVTDGRDEDGMNILSFVDLNGRLILKRQFTDTAGRYLDTYYIYNNAGSISYVVPPKALALMVANNNYSLAQTGVNKLIFHYVYDNMGRVMEKSLPGAGDLYLIYDPLNRPVLIQDARLRTVNQWNYIKYDASNRAISQGIYTDATNTTRALMQNYVTTTIAADYELTRYETRSAASASGYYTNSVFPKTGITPLAYSYYDDYDLDGNGTANWSYTAQSLPGEATQTTASVKGAPTMLRTRTVGTNAGVSNIWLLKVMFYDKQGHLIQTKSNNQLNYTSGVITDYATSVPDFTGKTIQTKVVKVTGTTATPVMTSVLTTMTYDHRDRVLAVDQSYNNAAVVHVASYKYNEIGQLVQKKLKPGGGATAQDITLNTANSVNSGSTLNVTASNSITLSPNFTAAAGSVFTATIDPGALQTIDFRYNIRGQLTSINNSKLNDDNGITNSDGNDFFGMQLLYDQADANLGNTPYFNGKLSAVKWMSRDATGTKSNERSNKYSYDALDRYTGSGYAERSVSGTGAFNINVNGFNENAISYDDGGNLLTLKRNSSTIGGSTAVEFDNLSYTYDQANPNLLRTVSDGTGSSYAGYGFRNLSGTTTGSYVYDANGNLTVDPYKNLTLSYNVLNRTDKITITSSTGRYIAYTYDSGGRLIRKQTFDNNILQTTTDYIDGFVYLNGILSYFGMPEVRVRNIGTGSTVTLKPEYIITDQQGNARISFEESSTTPGTAVVRQENSYYGFGLVMPGGPVAMPTAANKQLYNDGSEWQNDFSNLPDYYQTFYRNFDAALGRFIAVDPKVELSESMSAYQYAGNNPIVYNDPLGDRQQDGGDFGGGGGGGGMGVGGLAGIGNDYGSGADGGYGGIQGGNDLLEAARSGDVNALNVFALFNGGTQIYNAKNPNAQPLSSKDGQLGFYNVVGIGFYNADHSNVKDANGFNLGNAHYIWGFTQLSTGNLANQGGPGPWSTAIGLTFSWAFGTGDDHRTFTNDAVANSFRDARVVNQAREYWYKQVNAGKKTIYDGLTNFLGKKVWSGGNFGISGLIAAGSDPMEQFVGSFTPAISSDGINLTFTIQNTTSFKSLMYGIAPDWSRSTWGPGGNLTQTYIFTEPINFNRIDRFK